MQNCTQSLHFMLPASSNPWVDGVAWGLLISRIIAFFGWPARDPVQQKLGIVAGSQSWWLGHSGGVVSMQVTMHPALSKPGFELGLVCLFPGALEKTPCDPGPNFSIVPFPLGSTCK